MIAIDIETKQMKRKLLLIKILGDDYIKFQQSINYTESTLIDKMINHFENTEEYECCGYLVEIKRKLMNI